MTTLLKKINFPWEPAIPETSTVDCFDIPETLAVIRVRSVGYTKTAVFLKHYTKHYEKANWFLSEMTECVNYSKGYYYFLALDEIFAVYVYRSTESKLRSIILSVNPDFSKSNRDDFEDIEFWQNIRRFNKVPTLEACVERLRKQKKCDSFASLDDVIQQITQSSIIDGKLDMLQQSKIFQKIVQKKKTTLQKNFEIEL